MTFQDAELSRMVEDESARPKQSPQGFWASASAAEVSVQSILSLKCSQVIALREWLQSRLPMIISSASDTPEPHRVPEMEDGGSKVDQSPVDPFAAASAPLVDDVKSEDHVDPFARATAPSMVERPAIRWMVRTKAVEERFGMGEYTALGEPYLLPDEDLHNAGVCDLFPG